MAALRAGFFAAMILAGTNLLVSAAAAQNLVPNGSFNTDLSEWELSMLPDTSITWDAFGNPTGSLRMETTWANPNSGLVVVAVSPCLQVSPGRYTLRGDVFLQAPNGGCGVNWLIYFNSQDCTGNPGNTAFLSTTNGVWETQQSELDLLAERSYRVALFLQVDGSGALRSCNFDNVSLTGPRNLDVPTLGVWGLVALAAVLGVCGVMLSRRRAAAR